MSVFLAHLVVPLIIVAVWTWALGFIVVALFYRGELPTWLRFAVAITWPLSIPAIIVAKRLSGAAR